jgi:subtilisin-like proprotein convertase family protein
MGARGLRRVGIGVFAAWMLTGGIARAEWNPTPIAVPLINADAANSAGSPYPSRIEVHAPAGALQIGRPKYIILHAVTHPCPEDLAVLLVHGSDKYLLMSNAGGCHPLRSTDIVFSVGAGGPLPDEDATTAPYGTQITIAASNYGTEPQFPAPAPAGPYTHDMPFFGPTADGTWDLYVMDVHGGNRGVIAGGWSFDYPGDFTVLSDAGVVSIPSSGPAAVYPITLDLTPVAADARVRILQLGVRIVHSFSDDLRIVLQSPSGTAVVLMSNAGGSDTLNGNLLIFDDTAPSHVPDNGPVEFGSTTFYQPGSEYPGPTPSLPAPAPAAPYATAFAAFDNEPVRGTWKLWVFDDTAPNAGSIGTVTMRIVTDVPGSPAVTITSPTSAPIFTSTDPFVHVRAHVTNVDRPIVAIWRNQLGDGSIYASGSMQVVADAASASADIEADVPMRKGHNKLLIDVTPGNGPTLSAGDSLDVTVNEFTYSLPEGSTGVFWDEDVTLFSASDAAVPVRIDFLGESGPPPMTHLDNVPATAPLQLRVNGLVPPGAVSTIVHSTDAVPLAVERTMSWDSRGYGGSGGTAISPNTTWLFAEGSQGYFDTFLLLANDNDGDAHATVRFLLDGGGGSVDRAVTIAAHKRVTIYAADVAELANRNFGTAVNADVGITAERAMYFPHGVGRVFEGGHDSAGVNAARTRWFLAEGATGPFFECFILIGNPSMTEAHVRLRYLLASGEPIGKDVTVPALGRVTVNVEREDPRLANVAVSTDITSDVGIIVERSMYWPDISLGWREAHNSPGVAETALRWGVSDIRVGGPREYQTFILLANPGDAPAEVEVRLMRQGAAPLTRTYTLSPTSRTNVVPADFGAGVGAGTYSAEVQVLNFQGIVVEKAMYWNSGDEIWAAGTGVVATVLPPR